MKKFKKFLAIVTTAAVSTVSLCNMFSAVAANTSKTFRIYMDAPANSGIWYAGINLRYTPSVTDVCRLYKGTLDNDLGFYLIQDPDYRGIDVWAYFNTDKDLVTAGTLGVIAMTAPSNINDIFDVVDVNIERIENFAGVQLPTNRIRLIDVLVGDVNQDGQIDSSDETLLSNYLSGSAILSGNALRAADINGDFGVSSNDLAHLQKYLNGEISYFDK